MAGATGGWADWIWLDIYFSQPDPRVDGRGWREVLSSGGAGLAGRTGRDGNGKTKSVF